MKMKERNSQLKNVLGGMATPERVKEAQSIAQYDGVNQQGYQAYALEDELRLIGMLNTLKVENQYYRTENKTIEELQALIERLALKDPYFVAQAIVYSRCVGEGMRTINHLAAVLVAPFIAGQEYAKRFYGGWNKKEQKGGCVFRVDDMVEMKDAYNALNPKTTLSNAMKKGFASVIENLDTYQLAKYRKAIIDMSNLCHPKSSLSNAIIEVNGEKMKTLDAIMKGITVSADTWEVAQSEAGQEVAKAVREGKVTKEAAKEILTEAKNDNWEALLSEGKLGILAALRNIRNILKSPRQSVVDELCKLVQNGEKIRQGKVMPYHIDIAVEILNEEFRNSSCYQQVMDALIKGYETSLPNLKQVLTGKTCVLLDQSGSMDWSCRTKNGSIRSRCIDKGALIAATIAKACDGDVVIFGTTAEYARIDKTKNVFEITKQLNKANRGGTSIGSAFECMRKAGKAYDRVILISDNEANQGCTRTAYQKYIHDICSPYIYAIDLACYGTTQLKNSDKVNYYAGFGYTMFDDIASKEFNPQMHIDKVRKIVI